MRRIVRAGNGLVAVDEAAGVVSQAPSFLGTKGDTPDGQGGSGPWKALKVQRLLRQRPAARLVHKGRSETPATGFHYYHAASTLFCMCELCFLSRLFFFFSSFQGW